MKKITPIRHNKIWGYELWLHSPLENNYTHLENGEKTYKGPLVKIIKANKPLSVQVHPDDILAKKLENQKNGKSECWYILEATQESKFIVGISTINKSEIKTALENKDFLKLLKTYTPLQGDFINVPAGLVHGIGKKSKVLEVQQPSDTTYRFYDYDRLENGKPRELHIEKSIISAKELDWKVSSSEKLYKKYKISNYSVSIFEDKKNLKINKKSILVDLKKEIAYYVNPGDEIKINFEKFALIEY
ncbi:class I mannose-6-phosphate isomerase [Mycoplasma marinum]|uniref:Mannose-6-phosphate isomerase n=1 Tax=Mycoplasma marinum TaxID=1937190 RepID=A0A4R0XS76_9MOLU|nr:class I mannose-6-phosphate isomerase [Mycoplasma marinum]TCG11280.1 mannose-6-phosphate isomerase [Mycoplasma marinum]